MITGCFLWCCLFFNFFHHAYCSHFNFSTNISTHSPYKPEVELEAKMGLLRALDIEERPICVQTYIVIPRDMELSLAAKAFLNLIKSKA